MKKIFLILVLLLSASLLYSEEKAKVFFFYSNHCRACLLMKQEFIPYAKEKFKNKTEWIELETSSNQENLEKLYGVTKKFNLGQAFVPAILVGDAFLVGKKEIEENLENAIQKSIKQNSTSSHLAKSGLKNYFKKITFWAVIASGLIDGINPCAFAVIVFFISFLSIYGYTKKDLIYVGTSYCIAVFIAYLLIGLGVFKFLYAFSGFYNLMKIFYYAVAGFCFMLFIFSIYDYFKYKKTGQSEKMLLQLPKPLKIKINKIIGIGLREKEGKSILKLILISLAVGFLVSLIEAVCTGQVYVPTIVFIMKEPAMRAKAFLLLIIYNLMFIAPLVLVFLFSLAGYSSDKFNSLLKKHLGAAKILMAMLFLGLGILLLQM